MVPGEAYTKTSSPTDEEVAYALRTTLYGKCVYKCDNDVVDHQTVNMLFEDDITVTFTMCAFNKGARNIHIMGTKGELHATLDENETPISLYDFESKTSINIPVGGKDGISNGHSGGDYGIITSLYDYLLDQYDGYSVSDVSTSVNNHLLVFAAEQARLTGAIVDIDHYRQSLQHL